ncbi:acyltransferase [Saccharothrix sp. S26]|uniref:acyltransferase family protein n=1 Tax=Saccharothrix sp. S26 TaxID=2907215 RepID=UPI001F488979|nr:acyltransferase [Saccharothrix sp. S26]MCE6995504.1 acyltransferase [Saccharothrix sp. S26]
MRPIADGLSPDAGRVVYVTVVPRSRSGGRRASWDVLRAVAILFVVVQHATWGGPLLVSELGERPFALDVQVGASTLMVVSAYFVCQTLGSSGAWPLIRNRLARMLPPFAVAAVATWAVTRLWGPEALHRGADDLLATLLVLPPGLSRDLDLVDPSYWTVPLQVAAFAVVAVLWRGRWSAGWRLRALLWVAIVAPVLSSALVLPMDPSGLLASLHGCTGPTCSPPASPCGCGPPGAPATPCCSSSRRPWPRTTA